MRCLIIHNPASGPRSDEIFDFARALAQGGDEVTMRFIGDGMEPQTLPRMSARSTAWSYRAAMAPSPTCLTIYATRTCPS